MKTLTNEEIIAILENCESSGDCYYCNYCCPLAKECLHYYTGENCGSALEDEEED